MIDYELLSRSAEYIGVDLGNYGLDRFDTYAERLVRWNDHVNLTAITDPDEIVIKHFIDCLYITKFVSFTENSKLVDVGSGAGFPGIPLLIANPDLNVTFVDSVKKKLGFIKDVLRQIGLVGETRHDRAEELGKDSDFREKYDYATARAVAPLNELCEYCLPLVKVGGLFISMKGANGMKELDDAKRLLMF
ncbi:MAG: 16S rRNA (guanine(527)-N(7))-methyltransferase RsmG [Clostridiales bacterium]|nr:16S rRNA (guanine(527)-N(7))-methyltransferase RsmG [Clostridiales bacterium]